MMDWERARVDPIVIKHIIDRTNGPASRPTTADGVNGRNERNSSEAYSGSVSQSSIRRTDTTDSGQAHRDLRKGVKAVSFISKLIGNKKKEEEEEAPVETESVSNEGRPEGTDAQVFAQAIDNISFNPRQLQPPAYIKMRSKYKKEREFDRVFLAQELNSKKGPQTERQPSGAKLRRKSSAPPAESSTIWTMDFSKDGKYLAAAGVDAVVRVWAVLSSVEERHRLAMQESNDNTANGIDANSAHLSAPVFRSRPVCEFEGHTATVLDLSWSKNNFLLSSSMDKTVRLWHVSRSECLCTFKHNDFVPSISFHPKDDRFFLAGSLDSRLRLWSIPDKSVAFSAQLSDMITAVAFTPDGKYVMAGCLTGLCMFYETEGLKYQSQIHVRSSKGNNAKGAKITGMQAYTSSKGDIKLLVTSNDSRVRLYNFRDKNLEIKFRGNENDYSQIRASITDDGKYVVCGSEDRKAYIWSMSPAEGEKRDRRPMEMFEAHSTITTVVVLAPAKTRMLLGKSEDPIYDLCNPPPVTLLSREERAESQTSSRPPSGHGSIQQTPTDLEGKFQKPKESASYLARASHKGGNIIVTADFAGSIKVFRQDCAWSKRKPEDTDRSSLFSKRNSRLSRNGSIMSKASARSLRESKTSIPSPVPSDRINTWRQSVSTTPSINGAQRLASKASSRDTSPKKSADQETLGQKPSESNSAAKESITSADRSGSGGKQSHQHMADVVTAAQKAEKASKKQPDASSSPNKAGASAQPDNPLMLQNGDSYVFWNAVEWKDRAARMLNTHAEHDQPGSDDPNHLGVERPQLARNETEVSALSDEKSSGTVSEYGDAQEDGRSEMECRSCGGTSFSARQAERGTSVHCARCGEKA